MNENIIVRGARTHNLKNLSVEVPSGKYVVITGVSGSGKSSLALDTLYAEGQRRYLESLSTYARQFLEKMEKPDVDSIEGIYPAIAIQQRTSQANPRSTVATVTEIYDYLRLLYARIGKTYCYKCGQEITSDSPASILSELENSYGEDEILLIGFPLDRDLRHQDVLNLRKKGFYKVVAGGQQWDIDEYYKEEAIELKAQSDFYIAVDRVRIKGNRQRIADALETSFREGNSTAIVQIGERKFFYSDKFECSNCRIEYSRPDPRVFSFNSPFGACPKCQGFGNIMDLEPAKIIPDDSLALEELPIVPWNNSEYRWMYDYAKDVRQLPKDVPLRELTPEQYQLLWEGKGSFLGIRRFFDNLQNKRYKVSVRIFLARYRGYYPCTECHGQRLRLEGRIVKVNGVTISEYCSYDVERALQFLNDLKMTDHEQKITHRILPEIRKRLEYLIDVGLEYLTLERRSGTLSGGEAQRINLASCLGSSLVGTLYILDEPSVGLHARVIDRLTRFSRTLRDIGNTVVVVEHDKEMIEQADHILDLGPHAGERGGRLIFAGSVDQLRQHSSSLTAQYLRDEKQIDADAGKHLTSKSAKKPMQITLHGVRKHNLKNVTVKFPLGKLVCVTGVSGSGKSTLIQDILYPALCQELGEWQGPIGDFDGVSGADHISEVVFMDQSPPSRSSKSVPATYLKFFDDIRHLFAGTNHAKKLRLTASDFSFNVPGGRCEACEGEGTLRVGMLFLADVILVCDACKGSRYQEKVLEVKHKEKTIHDVLTLTVTEAMQFFADQPKIVEKLYVLSAVGLDYLRLGQPTSTLSGGEAQRLKLAFHLAQPKKTGVLYIFDEPTIGLHFDDIAKLLRCFRKLLQSGNSVICIEHNLDVIRASDHIIDLGPEGGAKGGQIIAEGSPSGIAANPRSITGRFLKSYLKRSS